MSKSRYVRLKDLAKLAEKWPNAILCYPVDPSKFDYSHRLAGEFYEEMLEDHENENRCKHVVVIK